MNATPNHLDFPDVEGYATRERAIKRAEEMRCGRFVIVALPNGRFAPAFMFNSDTNHMIGQRNILLVN